jgi:hypothetical protein
MAEIMDVNVARAKGKGIAAALKSIASATGQEFSMQTKPGRFRIQKTVYLLRTLSYPSALKFEYNIYLNGPYSPELAQVYYALEDDGLARAAPAAELSPKAIKLVAEAIAKGEDFLEGLTTVLDGLPREGRPAQAMEWAKSVKPHLNEETWREVKAFLAGHPDLTRRT